MPLIKYYSFIGSRVVGALYATYKLLFEFVGFGVKVWLYGGAKLEVNL